MDMNRWTMFGHQRCWILVECPVLWHQHECGYHISTSTSALYVQSPNSETNPAYLRFDSSRSGLPAVKPVSALHAAAKATALRFPFTSSYVCVCMSRMYTYINAYYAQHRMALKQASQANINQHRALRSAPRVRLRHLRSMLRRREYRRVLVAATLLRRAYSVLPYNHTCLWWCSSEAIASACIRCAHIKLYIMRQHSAHGTGSKQVRHCESSTRNRQPSEPSINTSADKSMRWYSGISCIYEMSWKNSWQSRQ